CVADGFDVIVAVGGDGTINNTARYVTGSAAVFGIVPQGSGNGLARHLHINNNMADALRIINGFKQTRIDTGMANNEFFINVAGVGFDAHVSWLFANAPRRGFVQYAKITLKEFAGYKARKYTLVVDGKTLERDAFIVCAANGSQYGNNVYIAPSAIVNDGLFEIAIIRSFSFFKAIALGVRMFTKTLHRSPLVELLAGKHLVIKRHLNEVINIDGEAVMTTQDVDIRMMPASLKIIVP
ncbi:MAG: diacylglycerol kinase family protein, partial [Bacteroidota bacterium]